MYPADVVEIVDPQLVCVVPVREKIYEKVYQQIVTEIEKKIVLPQMF